MKTKKALKRLNKIELLLSGVINQFSTSKQDFRELLDSARTAVVRAKESVDSQASNSAAKKQPVRAQSTTLRRGLTAEGRKKISLAAKKRWAAAKRKGVNAVTGRPLSKTA